MVVVFSPGSTEEGLENFNVGWTSRGKLMGRGDALACESLLGGYYSIEGFNNMWDSWISYDIACICLRGCWQDMPPTFVQCR